MRQKGCAVAIATAGVAAVIGGAVIAGLTFTATGDGRIELFVTGIALALAGLVLAAASTSFAFRACKTADRAHGIGYDEGWCDGFDKGREAGRPVVVPIRRDQMVS